MNASFFGMRRFNNFLHVDATDRRKISSDQKRLFIAVSLYLHFHFSRTLPLRKKFLNQLFLFYLIRNLWILMHHVLLQNLKTTGEFWKSLRKSTKYWTIFISAEVLQGQLIIRSATYLISWLSDQLIIRAADYQVSSFFRRVQASDWLISDYCYRQI